MKNFVRLLFLGLFLIALVRANTSATASANMSNTVGTVSMMQDKTLVFHLNYLIWEGRGPVEKSVALVCQPVSASYQEMLHLSDDIQPGETKTLPDWDGYSGVVTLSENKTLMFYERRKTNEGDRFFLTSYPWDDQIGTQLIRK